MVEEEHTSAQPIGYPRGPYDTLLVKYEHHIAIHIWFGERGTKKELKATRHGLKLIKRVPLHLPSEMKGWVSRSDLSSL
ncbi:unnamed protein product [Lathyrus sativus]|nr:unnamed protein product [Lathyrus sativus]